MHLYNNRSVLILKGTYYYELLNWLPMFIINRGVWSMKKYLPVLFLMIMTTGCGTFESFFWDSSPPPIPVKPGQPPTQETEAKKQLMAGKASFEQKLNDSIGLDMSDLLDEWGTLEPGASRSGLTVYHWKQTANLMLPPNSSENNIATPKTASCLAMFIVGPNKEVMDATAEGQCFDYELMPLWEPIVTQSTDGKIGVIK